jgi:pseudaminic acid cytidylyltransferase
MIMAVIPARGGSKRIPRKNIKDFCGKPMIAYAICAAKESGLFDRIVVSTDDDEIAEIANKWGAETPFKRPIELSDDYTATVPVVSHSIEKCKELGWVVDEVCCIYPCAPLIEVDDLLEVHQQFIKNRSNYCFPVTEFPSAIQRGLNILSDGKIQPFYPEFKNTRTQDLEPAYYDAGQFYWGEAEVWLRDLSIHSNAMGYIIPNYRVVDIDTEQDWLRAEFIYQAIKKNGKSITGEKHAI